MLAEIWDVRHRLVDMVAGDARLEKLAKGDPSPRCPGQDSVEAEPRKRTAELLDDLLCLLRDPRKEFDDFFQEGMQREHERMKLRARVADELRPKIALVQEAYRAAGRPDADPILAEFKLRMTQETGLNAEVLGTMFVVDVRAGRTKMRTKDQILGALLGMEAGSIGRTLRRESER